MNISESITMSNFISESERHEALYSIYDDRHSQVLSIFNKLNNSASTDFEIYRTLKEKGISDNEIEWLKRLGYYLPSVY